MALTWTLEELDALGRAIKEGVLEFEYQGPNGTKRAKYRSMRDMLDLYAQGERALGLTPKDDTGIRYLTHDRGTNR